MLTVNLTDGVDPAQEAALLRLVKTIRGFKKTVDGLVALETTRRAGNLTLALIRKHRDMAALTAAARQDVKFKAYLKTGLAREFGDAYAVKLLELFG